MISNIVDVVIGMSCGVLFIFGLPMLFLMVTAVIGNRSTMDKLLRGMPYEEVEHRVQWVRRHVKIARFHFMTWAIAVLMAIAFSGAGWLGLLAIWFMLPLMIHLLSLLLYTIRWNPRTLQRKRKIDAEAQYAGNYELDADRQYAVGDDGELVEVQAAQQAQAKPTK